MNLTSNVENSAGYVYYDLQIKNLANNKVPDNLIQLKFDEQRTSPIIDQANAYDMSITRFQCDTYSLPVYVAEIKENSLDRDTMLHDLILIYDNGTDRRFMGLTTLIWTPVDDTITPPIPPSQTPNGYQVDSQYYWCFDYDHVLKIVNTALNEAMDKLKADALLNPAIYPPDFADVQNPFMSWNDDGSNTATLYSRADLFNTANQPTALNPLIEVYFNPTLYSMFNSLPIKKSFLVDNGTVLGPPNYPPYYQIMIDSFNSAKTKQGLFNVQNERFIATRQQYSTISEHTPVSSLIFTSSTLPCVITNLSNPQLYQNNNLIQLSRPGNNFANIITDLTTDEQSYRGSILYFPTAEYRWISLTTSQPISQVDIQVYWKSKIGQLIPFTLPSGGSCSLKILFRKKQY